MVPGEPVPPLLTDGDCPVGPLWLVACYGRDRPVSTNAAGCAEWWKHDEAVRRLAGLWRAWEASDASDSATALALFWLNTADPTMDRLLSESGPFSACRKGHTDRLEPLPDGESPPRLDE